MDAEAFFSAYLALFVVMLFYAIGWIWKRQGWHKLADIDVDSGRRPIDWEMHQKIRAQYASWPKWRRFINHIF